LKQIVTITSNLSTNDHILGCVKAQLYSTINNVAVVDVAHNNGVRKQLSSIQNLEFAFPYYPKGTVHLLLLFPSKTEYQDIIFFHFHEQWFVGFNDGLLFKIFGEQSSIQFYTYNIENYPKNELEFYILFTSIAHKICTFTPIEQFAFKTKSISKGVFKNTYIDNNELIGYISYFDTYGNAVSNISETVFKEFVGDKKFKILTKSKLKAISQIHSFYNEVSNGSVIVKFNSAQLLEFAINQDSFEQLLGSTVGDRILIQVSES
jgi:S-adenosyl-L-methionine hydrolase (adenosine-forming)